MIPAPILAAIIAGVLTLLADVRRRRLKLTRRSGWYLPTIQDVLCPAFVAAVAAELLVFVAAQEGVLVHSTESYCLLVGIAMFAFLWREGTKQIQFQRPRGIIFPETVILVGVAMLVARFLFPRAPSSAASPFLSVLLIVLGCIILALIVPPFVKKGAEYHAILEHVQTQGESVQTEYTPPTAECPNPQLWHMADSQSTEIEVLEFLKALVTTIKPRLIVETGTFIGYGAIALAQGLKTNGFGRLITIEFDPAIHAKAKERIAAAGLADWVESRNESSTDTKIDGTIDLLFSDSALAIREQEIRRLLPQVSPHGLIAIHDASSHFKIVREAALRMEREGLLSVVMLPTPRGLVLAQKRESRV